VACRVVLYALTVRGCRVFCVSKLRVRCRTHDLLTAAQDTTEGLAEAPHARCSGVTVVSWWCYTVVTPLLHHCYTVVKSGVTLALHCSYTVVTLL
jgi:hypothetical protein